MPNEPKPAAQTLIHPRASTSHRQGMDALAVFHAITERLWLVFLFIVFGILAALGYIRRAPVLYASTATIQVEQVERKIINVDKSGYPEDLRNLDVVPTIAQSLKSRALLERVIDTNRLSSDPRFVGLIEEAPTRERLYRALAGMLEVRVRRGTRLIDITAISPFPEMTDTIVNSLVEEYMRSTGEEHVSSTEVATESLVQEAQRLKKKLTESENALQAYREQTGTVSLDQNKDTVVAKMKELSTRVTAAKSARINAESDYAQLQKLGNDVEALLVLPVVARDPKVVEIQMTINKLESDLANLRQRYKEKHPKFIQAVSQIEEWKQTFTNAVRKVPETVKVALESARAAEKALEDALKAQETAAMELDKAAIQYNVLLREVDSDRALYEAVLNQLKQTTVDTKAQPTRVKLVQPGYRPEVPFAPNKLKIVLISLGFSILAGCFLAVGLQAIDHSYKTVDTVESETGLPVLSAIPMLRELRTSKTRLVVSDDPKSPGAEAFRTLRVSLSMLGKAQDRRTFLMCSALPQEGKTFTSLNYAAALAQQGLRTVLIDCDLRKPSVEEYFGEKESQRPGVTDYLTGQKTMDEIVVQSKLDKLCYIPAGTTAPNPAELLGQGGFPGLLAEALQRFDRVVVDTAPVHAVSDTLLIAPHVQTACLVTRAAKTPRKAVLRALQMLRTAGAPIAGIVFNQLPRRGGAGYGYYYSSYYDYGYYGKYAKKGVYGAK